MAEYHLHKWAVVMDGDSFTAPELIQKRLTGVRCDDDREIVTSTIVSVEGRRVTTYSGSVYNLEDVSPEFLSWMQENGIEFDPENPIKIREV